MRTQVSVYCCYCYCMLLLPLLLLLLLVASAAGAAAEATAAATPTASRTATYEPACIHTGLAFNCWGPASELNPLAGVLPPSLVWQGAPMRALRRLTYHACALTR